MNQKISSVIAYVLIGAVAGLVLSLALIRFSEIDEIISSQQLPLLFPKRPISDETANWKTYRNDRYGFEVKYPPTWKVYDKGDFSGNVENCIGEYKDPKKRVFFAKEIIENCIPPLTHGWFWFDIQIKDDEYDESDLEKTGIVKSEGTYDEECARELDYSKYEPVTFKNIPARKTTEFAHTAIGDEPRTSISFNHNGYGWQINYLNDCEGNPVDPAFNQMLSTFRFLD